MASSLSSAMKLGNISPTSLIKSAASVAASVADAQANYEDEIQKINFDNNPTTDNLNAYIAYLQNRATTLANGSYSTATKQIDAQTKAAGIQGTTIPEAITKSVTFNTDIVATQILTG